MRSPRRVRFPRRATSPASLLTASILALGLGAGAAVMPAAEAAVPAASPAVARAAVQPQQREDDPRLTRSFYVAQTSQAYQAGQADPRFADIGNTPQAFWISDNWMPLDKVESMTRDYADKANAAGQTPLVAVYAIPGRDCGGYSGGGFDPSDYKVWINRMAKALKGAHAMAILEPDALGLLGQCDGQDQWLSLLKYATRKLSKADVWVYVDAAHNAWIKPREMARRLDKAGVRFARGYSTNIASFVSSDIDAQYAAKIAKALKKRGITGKHYITDTSRNGAGKADGNDWCNPLDARVGTKPQMVGQGLLDGYVWAKSPGESDGSCNGGPPAGIWWPEYALRLTGQL